MSKPVQADKEFVCTFAYFKRVGEAVGDSFFVHSQIKHVANFCPGAQSGTVPIFDKNKFWGINYGHSMGYLWAEMGNL